MNAPVLAPNSQDGEEAVLGAVLINPEMLPMVRGLLSADDFYFLTHRYIWQAIEALYDRGDAIDALTVVEELRHMHDKHDPQPLLEKVGGPAMITYLTNSTPTYLHAETYALMVQRLAGRRKGLDFATNIAKLATDDTKPFEDVLTEIQRAYLAFVTGVQSSGVLAGADVVQSVLNDFSANMENKSSVRGLRSDLESLNVAIGGFRDGLIAMGGATSMGKSTVAASQAAAFSRQAKGVYLTTEMHPKRAMARMLCDIAGIPYKTWLSGFLSEEQVETFISAVDRINAENITFLEGKAISPARIQAECVRIGAKWLIVDSASVLASRLIGKFKGDLRVATNYVSASLQDMSNDLVVVGIWQTGRNAKDRKDKRPNINDFKESGQIEEDADLCLGLYRHDYYVAKKLADPNPSEFPRGTGNIYIMKDRDGGEGNGKVTFQFKPGYGIRDYYDPLRGGNQ